MTLWSYLYSRITADKALKIKANMSRRKTHKAEIVEKLVTVKLIRDKNRTTTQFGFSLQK